MTRPKPPEPYESWLDYLLNPHRNGYETCVGYAAAELAELRAELAALKAEPTPDPADEYLRTAKESK